MRNIIAAPSRLNIQLFKEYEALYGKLDENVKAVLNNKIELWKYMQ